MIRHVIGTLCASLCTYLYKGPIGPIGPGINLGRLAQFGLRTQLGSLAQLGSPQLGQLVHLGPGSIWSHWPNWVGPTYLLLERDQDSVYKVCIYTYTYAGFKIKTKFEIFKYAYLHIPCVVSEYTGIRCPNRCYHILCVKSSQVRSITPVSA